MIFIDSSFLIGYFDANDQWHEKAVAIMDKIIDEEKIISNLVIEEIVTLIGFKVGAEASYEIYDHIHTFYRVVDENKPLYNKAMETFLKYDGKLSLTDTTSIEIMKNQDINKIASFDSDFDNKEKIVRIH